MMRAWKIEPSYPDNKPGSYFMSHGKSLELGEEKKVPIAPEHLPLLVEPFPGSGDLDEIPDFARGSMNSDIFVRQSFIDLVEEMDPTAAYFAPIVMIMPSGARLGDTFWRLQSANPIDAMILEKSTVRESRGFPGLYNWSGGRRLTFDSARIAGRHLWSQRDLGSSGLYASDAFVEEMKRRGMEPFEREEMTVE